MAFGLALVVGLPAEADAGTAGFDSAGSDEGTAATPAPLLAAGKPVDWWFAFKFNAASFPGCNKPVSCPFGGTAKDYKQSEQFAFASSKDPNLTQPGALQGPHRTAQRRPRSKGESVTARSTLGRLAVLPLVASLSGCHQHLRLAVPGTTAGERFDCSKDKKPCEPAKSDVPGTENPIFTRQVVLPAECKGLIHEVSIRYADTDDPQLVVICAPKENGVGNMSGPEATK